MSDLGRLTADLPPEQRAIRAKCFHPTGTFVQFERAEIEQSIPERFEKIVAKYPERIAVKTRNAALTYETLNTIANRIAWAILEKRGPAQEPIVLLFEHGAPMIAAILGVLKAGKMYLPLDSSLPPARIVEILKDSRAGLILTNGGNLSLARESIGNEWIVLNTDLIESVYPGENPDLSVSSGAPAYILYTSGSTGRPKGVVNTHRNELHNAMAYTNTLHFCANDRLTLLHSCAFAASRPNLFGALLNGAALYPFDIKRDGLTQLAEWLIREKITVYHSSAIVYRYFLDLLLGEEDFADLRLIKLGSQQVFESDLQAYKKHFSADCILAHTLSCTEANTFRWYLMDKETETHGDIVPVGYPVEDMEVRLLGDDGKAVGSDQGGEIAIRSPYLALGYWQDPDLSGAAFQLDPEGETAPIYRTGDLGVMESDGCLTHLGRKDFQVKVRGYRINLGEIETSLLALDTVRGAVVTTREDSRGEKRLVAYIVPALEPPPAVSAIRQALARQLPRYMVPSTFVTLDALPLTPNGKVDRGALPEPAAERPNLDVTFMAPRTQIEEVIADIWSEVLGLKPVGVHDNFLDLGGHSLMATQIISRVMDRFRVELPIRSLLEAPTVAEMALVITQNLAEKAGAEDLHSLLAELEALSDGEADRLLAGGQREDNVK